MDNDQINTLEVNQATWRMRADSGVLAACSPTFAWPLALVASGALLMRQWSGDKLPRPEYPQTVGLAKRPATTVDEMAGVTRSDGVTYWLEADRVSPAGIVASRSGRGAQPVAYAAGAWVGLMPNTPHLVCARQRPDGGLTLTWRYNPAGQQVAPATFEVYSDSGTGTLNAVALGSVTYVPGRELYVYDVAGSSFDGWQFVVRAKSAAAVESLLARPTGGVAGAYTLSEAASEAVVAAQQTTTIEQSWTGVI